MDLQTIATIFVICVFLYAVIGDALRNVASRLGVTLPSFDGLHWLLRQAWEGFVWLAYKLIVGREPPHSVKQSSEVTPAAASLPLSQQTLPDAQYPIAAPQNVRNGPVVIAQAINDLAELSEEDPRITDAVVLVLARLVAASELTQTAAIKVGLGIAPGSRSPRYQAARAALQAELTRLEAKPELVGEMADRIRREEATPAA